MKMLQHRFVEFIPDQIEEGILFISLEYCTAIHNCMCGCGNKVVTPISPTDWQMCFNGKAVTLKPSIGNWNFKCKSHYFIRCGEIQWCSKWSEKEIVDGRKYDKKNKEEFFKKTTRVQSPWPSIEVVKKVTKKAHSLRLPAFVWF